MMNKIIPFLILMMMASACNLPGPVTVPSAQTETTFPTESPAPTVVPSDLPFTIDCSALPASRQVDCDSFIVATRDQVYPILREITGVSLSKCYESVHYIILTTDPGPTAGGISDGDTITYNEKYSIDLPHRYDVHELLHSISTCAGALDSHIFHGMIMNYVYDRLGVHEAGYFSALSSNDLTVGLDTLLEKVKTASGTDLDNACMGILMRKMTILYFTLDAQSIQQLYRSTIPPLKITTPPNSKLVSVWNWKTNQVDQVEALLEMLKQSGYYFTNVPECGY
jgi:hypothetical protein